MGKCVSPVYLKPNIRTSNLKRLMTQGSGLPAVPCGQCFECKKNKTMEWGLRILHEAKFHESSIFVTLTYDPEFCPKDGSVDREQLVRFIKRLRKKKELRYFAVGEYGSNYFRPHYHLILFGLKKKDREIIASTWTDVESGKSLGFVGVGEVNIRTAQYCAKYVQKQFIGNMGDVYDTLKIKKEFMICSKGLGGKESKKYIGQWMKNGFIVLDGVRKPIPRYYLSKADEDINFLELRLPLYKEMKENYQKAKLDEPWEKIIKGMEKERGERGQRELNSLKRAELVKSKL